MKKLLLALAIAMLSAGLASAQVSRPFNVYAGGGVSVPVGDLGDATKMGFHGMGGIGFKLMPVIRGLAKVEYHTMDLDFVDSVGGSFKVTMFGVGAKVAPPMPASKIKLFGMAGVGIASYKFDTDEAVDLGSLGTFSVGGSSDSKNDMYFEIGGGVEIPAAQNMNLFAMVRFVSIATEGSSTTLVPITVGLKF